MAFVRQHRPDSTFYTDDTREPSETLSEVVECRRPEEHGVEATVVDAPIRGGYGASSTGDASGRAVRVIVGVLCLLGSLISAIAAIVLALITFSGK